MSETAMIVTMGSVFIGFVLFGSSYAAFSYKKPRALVWGLFAVAILFLTVVPVTVAVFFATAGQ
ncbi:hypothetical protein [Corynebacterium suicordis]|uniref:Uncharacterized protein n=1 Tax=Corynebacterium suicordis DSM 45110 TaxID=1121369 RepID=A0ABR9ZGQ7_9CORY|nr:hypothetical protein [Corynebacterium suicordis]MBF4552595.1 hypothetical protein [Corynebacterium suicordis DSM 45110]MDR6278447.1 putative membrane protein [Corynebacterium suicordis]